MRHNPLVVRRLDQLLAKADAVEATKHHIEGFGYAMESEPYYEWATSVMGLLQTVFGEQSAHYLQFKQEHEHRTSSLYEFQRLRGILRAAKEDFEGGYLFHLESLVAADLFADFLEMAEHLLNEGYKDPAAVLVGGVLEEHLRKLCAGNSISVEATGAGGNTHAKAAEQMNVDLAGARVYSKIDQQNVTAWLALRNRAAHGKYAEYEADQVRDMLRDVRHFISRNPA